MGHRTSKDLNIYIIYSVNFKLIKYHHKFYNDTSVA